jgi:hypothetical protein
MVQCRSVCVLWASALVALLVVNNTVNYIMFCFITGGLYTTLPLILNWNSECLSQPEQKRSVAIALVNSFDHTRFIYGSYLWPSAEAPRNLKGFVMSTAVLWFGVVLAALSTVIFRYLPKENPNHVAHGEEALVLKDQFLGKLKQ